MFCFIFHVCNILSHFVTFVRHCHNCHWQHLSHLLHLSHLSHLSNCHIIHTCHIYHSCHIYHACFNCHVFHACHTWSLLSNLAISFTLGHTYHICHVFPTCNRGWGKTTKIHLTMCYTKNILLLYMGIPKTPLGWSEMQKIDQPTKNYLICHFRP